MALHHRVRQAHREYQDSLTINERVAVFVTKNVGTMWCAYVFTFIGVGSLVGVFTNNTTLALLFGAVSSYFIQLVLLPVIMVGQDVQSRKSNHVLSELLADTEEILHIVRGVRPLKVVNEETGADIIMPNIIRERFDQGEIKSLADLV